MVHKNKLQSLSDDELLDRLSAILQRSRCVEAELVAHIAEVDARRLYAREACSSMFKYCTEVLHLTEFEAYLRIEVARASRRHPMLLEMLGDGRLHLSGISKLAPHLNEDNRDELLARATYKSKRQIEELIAELAPRSDVPATMRKLPTPTPKTTGRKPLRRDASEAELGPDLVNSVLKLHEPAPKPELLAPSRYKVQFTANAELHEKLERLTALMRASDSEADLVAAIDTAVTEKLERLEAKRFGKTKKPKKTLAETDTSPNSRYMPAAVRRLVHERDEGQCMFVGSDGRRCTERQRLEFHHDDPFGRGGSHDPARIRLLCKAHNLLEAERDYGKDFMDRYRHSGGLVRELRTAYAVGAVLRYENVTRASTG